jgi:Domain of unknown function (DUF6438)
MKTFLSLLIGVLISMSLAGELATLHQTIAPPVVTEKVPKQDLNLPDGVALAPGIKQVGSPVRSDPGIDEIGLERTRCLTQCPAYTLIIKKDGSFRYTGEYGVERIGQYTGTVSVGLLNQVLSFVNESLYFGFDDTYSAAFLDGPTTYTMVKKGTELKVIENYAGSGPATLWAIEQLIDKLLETAQWDQGGGLQ